MSREEGEVELSLKSTAHLLPPTITPFPFSIFLDLIIDRSFSALLECPQQCATLLYYYSSPFVVFFFSDIMYCFGPVLFWTLYDIYKSLSNLNPTELGLFFSGPGFKLLKDWFHDGGQCNNINESQERLLQFSHI
jgi:hypothetical protein